MDIQTHTLKVLLSLFIYLFLVRGGGWGGIVVALSLNCREAGLLTVIESHLTA